MVVENERDLLGLLAIGRIVAQATHHMAQVMEPGMTTRELDAVGAAFLEKHGARSAPISVYKFPGATCISINEEVAHGVPGDRVIQAGDLVNIDVSAELNGFFADTGATFIMPPSTPAKEKLCESTRRALDSAIQAVRADVPLYVIGKACEAEAKRGGYKIIRELNGHGVGRGLHEEPRNVPHFFTARAKEKLRAGTVLTIEPFFNTGNARIVTGSDGWTLKTLDGSMTAQYEHTIVVTKDKPIIVTLP